MADGSIVKFDKIRTPISRKPRSYDDCRHKQTEVDVVLRKVTCLSCKTELDPIAVLLALADSCATRDYRIYELRKLEDSYKRRNEKSRERRAKKQGTK